MDFEDARIRVVVEVGAHQLWVGFAEGEGGFFDSGLEFEEMRLKLLLNLLNIGVDFRESSVGVVGDEIENPPAGIGVETVDVTGLAAIGYFAHAHVEGEIAGGIGVIPSEPGQAADFIRESGAGLGEDGAAGLRHGDGALPGVADIIHFPGEGPIADGVSIGAGINTGAHIVRGAVIAVAGEGHDIADGEFFIRGDGPRVELSAGNTLGVIIREIQRRSGTAEEAPDAFFAGAFAGVVDTAIGGFKGEGLAAFGVVAAGLNGEGFDVGCIEAVLGVVPGEIADSGLVSVSGDMSIGDFEGNPDGAGIFFRIGGAGADDFKDPDFIGVANGEGFAQVDIAVLFNFADHDLDGLAGGACLLESDGDELGVFQRADFVLEFGGAFEGGFGDGDLVFIHDALETFDAGEGIETEDLAGRQGIGDVGTAVGGTDGAIAGREDIEPDIESGRIGGIGDQAGAVGGGAFGDEYGRTGPERLHLAQEEQEEER